MKIPTIKLNDGNEIPILGFGTYSRVNSRFSEECQQAVAAALAAGYRHIDTASFYENEEDIGLIVNREIKAGNIKREELFITTKMWNDCHEESKVLPSLKESLKKLGLDYVDLYLIHWPLGINEDGSFNEVDYIETWRGMEECQKRGLAKSIGVSNFNIQQLDRLLNNCKVRPALNQFEINPTNTQYDLCNFCKSQNVAVSGYCPLGFLPTAKTSADAPPPRMDDPKLVEIANKYGKTVTQVVIRYQLDRGLVTTPKSVTPSRVVENFNVFDFSLTPEEVMTIDSFNKDRRVVPVSLWSSHKYYPF